MKKYKIILVLKILVVILICFNVKYDFFAHTPNPKLSKLKGEILDKGIKVYYKYEALKNLSFSHLSISYWDTNHYLLNDYYIEERNGNFLGKKFNYNNDSVYYINLNPNLVNILYANIICYDPYLTVSSSSDDVSPEDIYTTYYFIYNDKKKRRTFEFDDYQLTCYKYLPEYFQCCMKIIGLYQSLFFEANIFPEKYFKVISLEEELKQK